MSAQQEQQEQQELPPETRPRRRGGSKRQPLSCLPCRRHKLRCDRHLPCGTCVRYCKEIECRLNPAPPRKTTHHSQAIGASGPSQDTHCGADESPVPRVVANGETAQAVPSNLVIPERQQPSDSLDGFVQHLKLLCSIDIGSIPSISLPLLLAQTCRQQDRGVLWKTAADSQFRHLIWKQQLAAMLPSRAQCDLLVNFYIEHINWIFQTLHVPSFRQSYSKFWGNEAGQEDFVYLSLLFTILSVSALYVPLEAGSAVGFPTEAIRPLAMAWHNVSQHALRAGDYESQPSIRQLQTFVITQLYWYATNQLDTLNSRLGQAVRCAQALGLDRDTSVSTCLQDEIRHRMWWELVDSDMFQTICMDRAPLIRLKQSRVPLPLNCGDSDMTETSIFPRPMDQPTEMALNISRARLFQLLNMRYHGDDNSDDASASPYDRIRDLDSKVERLLAELPWYFQINEHGQPPQLPEHVYERLTWQHHILRTCICTQRIRMYRPFLAADVEGARDRCVKAALDAVAVYRSLRQDIAQTSWYKFLPQAYQIFSVAVTVAALFLVEGNIHMPSLYETVKDMATDLQILDRHGCHVPVAMQGRKVLLKLLSLVEMRSSGVASPEEAQSLVPQISCIMGGERTTREYMSRLTDDPSPAAQVGKTVPIGPETVRHRLHGEGLEVDRSAMRGGGDDLEVSWMDALLEMTFDDMETASDSEGVTDAPSRLELFNWDMTGFLINAQQAEP